jgi:carbon-monoxide dehydrogenase medium subunit
MKPPPFKYYDPGTIAEALNLLSSKENAKLLAGGQSLMSMLNMRYVQPDHVIDLNKIAELSFIRADEKLIHIGAMTRQRDLEFSSLIRSISPLVYEALTNVGHRQTRNRGTIGGSLCHLDPSAELPAVAAAYDAIVEVRSESGSREVPMTEFPAFFMTPAIEPNEIVTGLRFVPWPKGHGSAFVEFSRRHGDFALASVAVLLDLDGDLVRRASITVGGLSHGPKRVTEAEQILQQGRPTTEVFQIAANTCGTFEATGDIHGSASYRQHVAQTLAFRAMTVAYQRATDAQSRSLV